MPYFNVTSASDPAALAAEVSFEVVNEFIKNTPEGQQILPLGYGVNVNIPELFNATMPPVVKTRLTGNANTDVAVFNETSGLFTWDNLDALAAGINAAYNGDASLPGGTWVVAGGGVSVSVFTMDFSATSNKYTELIYGKAKALFSGSASVNEKRYSKMMVEERMRKRGATLSGRDGGA